jgi:hypothetical protein
MKRKRIVLEIGGRECVLLLLAEHRHWVVKHRGEWRLTDAGRKALEGWPRD